MERRDDAAVTGARPGSLPPTGAGISRSQLMKSVAIAVADADLILNVAAGAGRESGVELIVPAQGGPAR